MIKHPQITSHSHTVCTVCKANLPICSKCGSTSGQKFSTLSEDTTFYDCVYKEKGCLDRLKREEIFQHVKTCRYKKESVQLCKLLGFEDCKYVHKLDAERSQIIKHFVEEHDSSLGHGKNGLRISHTCFIKSLVSSENSVWRPVLISLDEEGNKSQNAPLFLVTGKVDVEADCATWTCVKLWGKELVLVVKANCNNEQQQEEESYEAEFVLENECMQCWKTSWEFEGPSQQIPFVKWTIPVSDAGEEKRHLETSPVIIPLKFIRKLYVVNRDMNLGVTIQNKKMKGGGKESGDLSVRRNEVETVSTPLKAAGVSVENRIMEKKKMVLAPHIVCDGCEQFPIIGTQYKCLQCPDFDLCEKCMEKEIHSFHVFVVLANKTQNQIIRRRRSRSVSQLRA